MDSQSSDVSNVSSNDEQRVDSELEAKAERDQYAGEVPKEVVVPLYKVNAFLYSLLLQPICIHSY
jgi:hypothetical protein